MSCDCTCTCHNTVANKSWFRSEYLLLTVAVAVVSGTDKHHFNSICSTTLFFQVLVAVSCVYCIPTVHTTQQQQQQSQQQQLQTKVFLPRKELHKILNIMQRKTPSVGYYAVTGALGCGKTALVTQACNHIGKGAIYVACTREDFEQSFAAQIGFVEPTSDLSKYSKSAVISLVVCCNHMCTEPKITTKAVLQHLVLVTAQYTKESGIPLVVVFDEVQHLDYSNMATVKSFAEEGAVNRTIVTIFVSTGSATQDFLASKCN